MGSIPPDARWYYADLVMEITVEGDPRNVVHVNTCLIEADSPEQAYEKANALGRDSEYEDVNPLGKKVHVVFRGLGEFDVIHDPLEDGAELFYSETVGLSEDELRQWVTPKDKLNAFRSPTFKGHVPNYSSEWLIQTLESAGLDCDAMRRPPEESRDQGSDRLPSESPPE